MRQFTLNLSDNPRGADPKTGLYAGINRLYSSLGLQANNSSIVKLISSATPTEPGRAFVRIQKGEDISDIYDFYFTRFDITQYVKNPFWTASQITQAKAAKNSAGLIQLIANRANMNFRAADFWSDATAIDYTGGVVTPNFLFKALYNNIYFYGEVNLWLHNGQSPQPILN